jgi:hypothetical protein
VVNFATRTIGLLLLTTLLVGGVAAEDVPLPDPDGLELPQDSMLSHGMDDESLPMGNATPSTRGDAPSRLISPQHDMHAQEAMPMHGDGEPVSGDAYPEDVQFEDYGVDQAGHFYPWDSQPAPIESSGTWLNRGVWYAEADVIMLHRIWQRSDVLLAFENNQATNRLMFLQASHPGADAGVRTTLGRFLFRDDNNRDHTLEFTAFSFGEFTSDVSIGSLTANNLFVPSDIAGNNPTFNQSSEQRAIYSSRLNSFELNYHLKRRLGRDQMVMDPNGSWRRESAKGFNRDFIAGFRYLELRETFNWTAEDVVTNGNNGQYFISTDNDLFGFQMGEGIEYATGRWSLGLNGRMGLFINDADAYQRLNFTSDDDDDYERSDTEDEFSWMGEAHVTGKYHLTPNTSLRCGLDVFVIDSLALAPRQANFIDVQNNIETGGNPWYLGGSLGFECYW